MNRDPVPSPHENAGYAVALQYIRLTLGADKTRQGNCSSSTREDLAHYNLRESENVAYSNGRRRPLSWSDARPPPCHGRRSISCRETSPLARRSPRLCPQQQSATVTDNKKAVLSQRWPRDAPTKVNKQPHLYLRSRDSRLTQFNRTLWT